MPVSQGTGIILIKNIIERNNQNAGAAGFPLRLWFGFRKRTYKNEQYREI